MRLAQRYQLVESVVSRMWMDQTRQHRPYFVVVMVSSVDADADAKPT